MNPDERCWETSKAETVGLIGAKKDGGDAATGDIVEHSGDRLSRLPSFLAASNNQIGHWNRQDIETYWKDMEYQNKQSENEMICVALRSFSLIVM